MTVSATSISEWLACPPESLVIGECPYAKALAFVLGTVPISHESLTAEPSECLGGSPLVFESLRHCFVVVSDNMAASEAIRCHDLVWHWVESISSVHELHELSILFVVPPSGISSYEQALAVGLATPQTDLWAAGHGVCSCSSSLVQLLTLVAKIRPADLQTHRARLRSDTRRVGLSRLRAAVLDSTEGDVTSALADVLTLFRGQEVHLDLFCRPPSHRNANQFRNWLVSAETEGVTSDWWKRGRLGLRDWLQEDLLGVR